MGKVRVSQLHGTALDVAVGHADQLLASYDLRGTRLGEKYEVQIEVAQWPSPPVLLWYPYAPSSPDWRDTALLSSSELRAMRGLRNSPLIRLSPLSPEQLLAAMRIFVASRLGMEIESDLVCSAAMRAAK